MPFLCLYIYICWVFIHVYMFGQSLTDIRRSNWRALEQDEESDVWRQTVTTSGVTLVVWWVLRDVGRTELIDSLAVLSDRLLPVRSCRLSEIFRGQLSLCNADRVFVRKSLIQTKTFFVCPPYTWTIVYARVVLVVSLSWRWRSASLSLITSVIECGKSELITFTGPWYRAVRRQLP